MVTSIKLQAEPLTAGAFEPFGDVIQKRDSDALAINYGQTLKYPDQALIDTGESDGRTVVHIYRSEPLSLPLRIERMERHPLGSQAFIPLHGRPFLVVVAPAGDKPEIDAIRCFVSNGEQGVNYRKGVWHHYQISLGDTCEYLVIDRGGAGDNCDEQELEGRVVIEAQSSIRA